TIFVLVFFIHMIYPYFAIKSNYASLEKYKGLSTGWDFIKQKYPDNYRAIQWLNDNIDGQPVMVEAVGDSYTDFNQVSVATGLPTVEGWIVHEWLWRGGYDKPSSRKEDVKSIYQSQDLRQLKQLLQKYSVKYIFVGDKEYEAYPDLDTKRFEQVGARLVASFGNTDIFRVDF
ncbi:hypothetical protein DRH14_01090, partial [Candidatus Shapirobacteria bacterium]